MEGRWLGSNGRGRARPIHRVAEMASPKVALFKRREEVSQEARAVDRRGAKGGQAAEGSGRGMMMTKQKSPNWVGKRVMESKRAWSQES